MRRDWTAVTIGLVALAGTGLLFLLTIGAMAYLLRMILEMF